MYEDDETRLVVNVPGGFPRLIVRNRRGNKETFAVDKEHFTIGRADDCDLVIKEQSISRKHVIIQQVAGTYTLQDQSVNGTLVNGALVKQRQLEHGDIIEIGGIIIEYVYPEGKDTAPAADQTIVLDADKTMAVSPDKTIRASDRPRTPPPVIKKSAPYPSHDSSPVASSKHEKSFDQSGFSRSRQRKAYALPLGVIRYVGGVFLAALLIFLAVYLWNRTPTQESAVFQKAINHYQARNYEKAIESFSQLLRQYPISKYAQPAKKYLGLSYSDLAGGYAQGGDLVRAKEALSEFISSFPYNPEIGNAREKLNFYRLQLARRMENDGNTEQALAEYSAVENDSRYYGEAQGRVGGLRSGSREETDDSVKTLLEEGERYFAEGKYLAPPSDNAGEIYQKVLAIQPAHEVALKRIEQIKAFYLQEGQNHIIKGDYKKALECLMLCSTVDSNDEVVKKRIQRLQDLLSRTKNREQ